VTFHASAAISSAVASTVRDVGLLEHEHPPIRAPRSLHDDPNLRAPPARPPHDLLQRFLHILRPRHRRRLDDEPLHASQLLGRPETPPLANGLQYVRRGTANIFCIIEVLTGRRLTHATRNRSGPAFAPAVKRIARRYPRARTIHLVVDNLSTHSLKCVTVALGTREAMRSGVVSRCTSRFTPKHGSWLNAAEMEVSLVVRECFGRRRIGSLDVLRSEVAAWNRAADRRRQPINWRFRVADARRVFR
jgi:hypothetical protein